MLRAKHDMPRYQVRVAPRAQARSTKSRLVEDNRQAAPTLVVGRVEAAGERLTFAALSGAIYRQRAFPLGAAVCFSPAIRYHIYYEIDEPAGVVRVVAFLACGEGQGATLLKRRRHRWAMPHRDLWKASLRLGRLLGRRFRRQFEPRQFVHGAPPVSSDCLTPRCLQRIPASDCERAQAPCATAAMARKRPAQSTQIARAMGRRS